MLVELPNNQSAVLREYDELTERQARRIRGALRGWLEQAGIMSASGFDEADPATWGNLKDLGIDETAYERYADRCIVEMVKSWTFGDLPTMETVGDLLPATTYQKLSDKAIELSRGDEASGVEGATDPKVLIENSNVSAPISSDVASNQLTPTLLTNGESTVTAL